MTDIFLLFLVLLQLISGWRQKSSLVTTTHGRTFSTECYANNLIDDLRLIDSKPSLSELLSNYVEETYGVLGLQATLQYLPPVADRSKLENKLQESMKLSRKYFNNDLSSLFSINSPKLLAQKARTVSALDQRSLLLEVVPIVDDMDLQLGKQNYLQIMKIMSEKCRWEKEISNMKILRQSSADLFVPYRSSYSDIPWTGNQNDLRYIVLMDRGEIDVAAWLEKESTEDMLRTDWDVIKKWFIRMARIIYSFHSRGLVWTDVKLSNFLLSTPSSTPSLKEQSLQLYVESKSQVKNLFIRDQLRNLVLKAIDVESATKEGGNLQDFSPFGIPPEHASLLSQGQLSTLNSRTAAVSYKLNLNRPLTATFKQDIWALGMAYASILHGEPIISPTNLPLAIRQVLSYDQSIMPIIQSIKFDNLRKNSLIDLIQEMLSVEPSKRPSIWQILFKLQFI